MADETVAVLGTGMVGREIASALIAKGVAVRMGSRTRDNEAATTWAAEHGERATHGTFAEVAAGADFVVLAVKGEHALAVVDAAGSSLDGRIVLDLTNPLDFSQGFPPRLSVCNDDSLGEQIQRAAPNAKVVKTLNTLSSVLMVAPGRLSEPTHLIMAGNDEAAKASTADALRRWFGWEEVVDLGDISGSRGLEAWLLLWTRLYGALGTGEFNLKLVRA